MLINVSKIYQCSRDKILTTVVRRTIVVNVMEEKLKFKLKWVGYGINIRYGIITLCYVMG